MQCHLHHQFVLLVVVVLVVVSLLFLRMVVWQPFCPCWRYIIARVSEMHVAYQNYVLFCGLSLHRNITTNKTSSSHFPVLFLPEFHSVSRCEGRKCIVLGLCNASLLSSLTQFLLSLLLFVVPQDGCLAAIWQLLALYHCACLRNARRISKIPYHVPLHRNITTTPSFPSYSSPSPSLRAHLSPSMSSSLSLSSLSLWLNRSPQNELVMCSVGCL